jgi:hypothetical protein
MQNVHSIDLPATDEARPEETLEYWKASAQLWQKNYEELLLESATKKFAEDVRSVHHLAKVGAEHSIDYSN